MGHPPTVGAANRAIHPRTAVVRGVQLGGHGKINALLYVCLYLIARDFVDIPQRIVLPEGSQD